MGAFDWIEDGFNWAKDRVEDVGKGIAKAAAWTFDNVPGMDLLADAGGILSDVVLAPIDLTTKLGKEIGKIDGLGFVGDLAELGEKVAEEVNSNANMVHMAAYAARDMKNLKDALKSKKRIEETNRNIQRMNDAKTAAERAKYANYLTRGKGVRRASASELRGTSSMRGNAMNRQQVGRVVGRAGSGLGATRKGFR